MVFNVPVIYMYTVHVQSALGVLCCIALLFV